MLEYFKLGKDICTKTFEELTQLLDNKELSNTKEIHIKGMEILKTALNKLDKYKVKRIAFPVSININHNIDNYLGTEEELIEDHTVIKIKFGVNINDCIYIFADTFIRNSGDDRYKYITYLHEIKNNIAESIGPEGTDETKHYIQNFLIERECFPVENCLSYQQLDGHIKTPLSKYISLNHKKYYNYDDELIGEPDINYEYENNDIFTMEIQIIPYDHEEDDKYDKKYYERKDNNGKHIEAHIGRLNEFFYGLRQSSSREFYTNVKKQYGNDYFDLRQYKTPRERLGIKECIHGGILDRNKMLCLEDTTLDVYTICFVFIIIDDQVIII